VSKEAKIRHLVNKHPEDENIVLMDIMQNLIGLQMHLGKLEVFNYKDSVTESIKSLAEVELQIKKFKHRLREEVRPEVIAWHNNKPKQKRKMNPNSLKNLKNRK